MLNTGFNRIRRRMGLPYWSLSAWTKLKVKNAVNYIGAFEDALANEARRVGADGVVCGHIHHAQISDTGRFAYLNSGDWVESCTAIAEHHNGAFEIIRWTELRGPLEFDDEDVEQPALVEVSA
jgi:UDP-2,3-diacylglucosamine pyrophosphatase LpxH